MRTVCEKITSFLVMDILERAEKLEIQGHKIIHLEIGQPDFETPKVIREAATKALQDGKTAYTHSLGIYPLREAISSYYQKHYGLSVSPERIVVTNGTSPAMLLLFSALLETNDTVIMPAPTYACYDNFVEYAGGTPLRVPSSYQQGFQLDVQSTKQAITNTTRAILINSPSNPAGSIMDRQTLQEIANLGKMIISDEIYHGLTYEGKATSALEVTENCCILDGFSKRYAMTGWRLGWMVLPDSLIPLMQKLLQNFFISANSMAQWAGIAALNDAWSDVENMVAEYDKRRHILLEGLQSLGFGVNYSPQGAFYILVDAHHISNDSLALAFDILEKAHVGVAPGLDFGKEAEGFLRFSYANSQENIEEALMRLRVYLERTV